MKIEEVKKLVRNGTSVLIAVHMYYDSKNKNTTELVRNIESHRKHRFIT